jgi:hypothetical protein
MHMSVFVCVCVYLCVWVCVRVCVCVWVDGCDKVTSTTNFLFGEVWSHLNRPLSSDNFIFRDK